jgi:hypothetical protein
MKTFQELNQLKDAIAGQDDGMIVINGAEVLELIEQVAEQQKVINRWFGFMKFMALRSTWARQINVILNEYLYGTNDAAAIEAAKLYAKRMKMHNISDDD